MRTYQTFDSQLQIKIERRPDRAAKSRILRHDFFHKMWREARGIDAQNFRRRRKQRLLVARDDSQIGKPRERPRVFTICFFRMAPGIEASRRLRETGQEYCFAQSKI